MARCLVMLFGVGALFPEPCVSAVRLEDQVRVAPQAKTAIWAKNLGALIALMEKEKIDPDERFEQWRAGYPTTLLAMAMVAGHLPTAEYLLEQGASVDLMSTVVSVEGASRQTVVKEAYTPLMLAASTGFAEGAQLLLANGADVDAAGDGGCTALIVAAAFDTAEVGRLLLASKPDLELSLESTRCLSKFPMSNVGRQRDAVKSLPEADGATALWVAAAAGSAEMVKLLLDAGADRSKAASCDQVPAAGPAERVCTPERIAALLGRQAVAGLLAAGEKPAPGGAELRPNMVQAMSRTEVHGRLLDVMSRNDAAALKAYIDGGLDVNEALPGMDTALIMACAARAPQLVKVLLDNGADPSHRVRSMERWDRGGDQKRTECESQWNALLTAIESHCEECVGLLLDAGLDPTRAELRGGRCVVDKKDKNGLQLVPPLALAAHGNSQAIVRRLLAAGADVNGAVESNAWTDGAFADRATPLWVAVFTGDVEAARLLLEAGADPDAEAYCAHVPQAREHWCSARELARLMGKPRIAEVLEVAEPSAKERGPSP